MAIFQTSATFLEESFLIAILVDFCFMADLAPSRRELSNEVLKNKKFQIQFFPSSPIFGNIGYHKYDVLTNINIETLKNFFYFYISNIYTYGLIEQYKLSIQLLCCQIIH